MTTTPEPMTTRRQRRPERNTEILSMIHDHPGLDALELRVHGLRKTDGRLLREMEDTGVIEYKGTGWRLTAKGDIRLLEKSASPEDVQAGG